MRSKLLSVCIILLGVVFFVSQGQPGSAAIEHLDYGLYWYGYNNNCEKFVSGQGNQYYDPSKPVVIYCHGWQNGTSVNGYARENFHFVHGDADVFVHHSWLEKGWNVGVFYWNQFADESEVADAEAKIWSAYGPKGMRYRLDDGTYSTTQSPGTSIGNILYQQYVQAVSGNTSGKVRIAGHSLGSQLACYLAGSVFDAINDGVLSENMLPDRVALLDPAWTKNGKSYLGDMDGDGNNDWTGERSRWWLFDIMDEYPGFVVELYNTTGLDLGFVCDNNSALREQVACTSLRPWYYNSWEIDKKHVSVRYHYFWTYDFEPPVECTISWWRRKATGKDAASASTPDWRIKDMMGSGYYWDQVEGRYTETPSDDWFERKSQ